jgi:eukaryotic-like serine/threonine-protein kinase
MTLSAGTRLGPNEILSPLGAGGMGEVYRARDPRLGRDVAIKVLPASLSNDADRLRRFEQEARAAGVLNHPNITAVYDVGTHLGSPYIVQELLEGETLRSELASGSLSPRKAIDYALQIAHGLAAAHEKAIVHRDLKPENLFVTQDGRVKILDLGLAKLIHPETSLQEQTSAPTQTRGTEPGVVMGTVGYMSPEQARGHPADHRSDIFSFGSILYEMLSGRSPFRGESAVETMSAILKEDPADLSETNRSLPAGLERLVRHCLEKRPEQRFQSARDIAFDLETMSSAASVPPPTLVPARARRRWLHRAAVALVPVATLIVGLVLGSRIRSGASPVFHQLTFQRGTMLSARFAPDGQAILYGAAWNGNPFEVFETRAGSTLSRSLGLPPGDVFAVSDSGSVALSLDRHFASAWMTQGTLAQVALAGGSPRALAAGISWAD